MNIAKMIARVEKMKLEVVAMQKEVKAASKAELKKINRLEKQMKKLRDKLAAMTPEQRGEVQGTEESEKSKKLKDGIDDLQQQIYTAEDGTALGSAGDSYADDGIIGSVEQLDLALDALVHGKGKRRQGFLVTYEEQLSASSAK